MLFYMKRVLYRGMEILLDLFGLILRASLVLIGIIAWKQDTVEG